MITVSIHNSGAQYATNSAKFRICICLTPCVFIVDTVTTYQFLSLRWEGDQLTTRMDTVKTIKAFLYSLANYIIVTSYNIKSHHTKHCTNHLF